MINLICQSIPKVSGQLTATLSCIKKHHVNGWRVSTSDNDGNGDDDDI